MPYSDLLHRNRTRLVHEQYRTSPIARPKHVRYESDLMKRIPSIGIPSLSIIAAVFFLNQSVCIPFLSLVFPHALGNAIRVSGKAETFRIRSVLLPNHIGMCCERSFLVFLCWSQMLLRIYTEVAESYLVPMQFLCHSAKHSFNPHRKGDIGSFRKHASQKTLVRFSTRY